MRGKTYFVKKDPYTSISNEFCQRRDVTYEAKGLAMWISSIDPHEFDFKESYFYEHFNEDGSSVNRMKTTRSALKELENKKFLYRTQGRDNKGKFIGTLWYFDTLGIKPYEIAIELQKIFGLEEAIKILNKDFPKYEIHYVDNLDQYPPERVVYLLNPKETAEKMIPEDQIDPDTFWDFIARVNQANNAKAYANKMKLLYRRGKFDDYEEWREKYHEFMNLAVGNIHVESIPDERLYMINIRCADIMSLIREKKDPEVGGMRIELNKFLLDSSDLMFKSFFKELRSNRETNFGGITR